jgi:hypothetical protein
MGIGDKYRNIFTDEEVVVISISSALGNVEYQRRNPSKLSLRKHINVIKPTHVFLKSYEKVK